jgi:hypothetical protein
MLWTISRSLLVAALFLSPLVPSAFAQDFYGAKTVRFIVGAPPGGGFDTYSRAITRHIGKHIPGNPTMLVDNIRAQAVLGLPLQLVSGCSRSPRFQCRRGAGRL